MVPVIFAFLSYNFWSPTSTMDYHGGFGCFIWTWERILRKQFWIGSNFLLYTQAADAENSTKCNQIEQVRLGYGSIPINTIFRGMNIHKSQLQYFDVNYRGTLGDLTHLHKVSPLSPKTSTDQQMLRLCTSRVAGSGQVGRGTIFTTWSRGLPRFMRLLDFFGTGYRYGPQQLQMGL